MTNLVSKSTIVQICRGAWLPQYDVRFIAINDDVDSAKGENDFAVFLIIFLTIITQRTPARKSVRL